MSNRTTLIVSLALILIAVAISAAAYNQLPVRVASHWGANDEVNGTMSRFWGAFFTPVLALAVLGLLLFVPNLDPMKANIAAFRPIFNAFIVAILVFLLYLHTLTILWNLGYQNFRMSTALLPGLGLIFIFAGLMMRQAKRNFFIGIRTPWTLSSDRVWAQTHRVGSALFIACGILALFCIFVPGPVAYIVLLGPLFAATIFLVVYSYWLYQQETRGH
ncbi:MAG: SdpI family protein [Anaerolineae bacterium]